MKKVMIIDDNTVNLMLAKSALSESYSVMPISSGKKALKLLERVPELPDLLLLDVEMPEMDGFEVIKIFKENDRLKSIPVIFLTAHTDPEMELKGLYLGAVDYILKPFSPLLLQNRVALHMKLIKQKKELEALRENLECIVNEKTQNISQLQYSIIYSIADLLEKKDGYTGGHSDRVSVYLEILLRELIEKRMADNIDEFEVKAIVLSSKLHDAGKIAIPDEVLLKEGRLLNEEFDKIKKHTSSGADSFVKSLAVDEETETLQARTPVGAISTEHSIAYAKENLFLQYALDMAGSHHEKWDGSGYPDGKKHKEIPFTARVLAVVDVYDALRSYRPYKEPYSHEVAVDIIKNEKGISFDPQIVDVFLEIHERFNKAYTCMIENTVLNTEP